MSDKMITSLFIKAHMSLSAQRARCAKWWRSLFQVLVYSYYMIAWLLLSLALPASNGFALAADAVSPAHEGSAASLHGHPADVVLPDTLEIDFVSSVNGHRYAIQAALPDVSPPPGGYPVIYVLDGNGYFPSVVGAARINGNAPQAIVVGIGYPRDSAWIESVLAKHRPLPANRTPSFSTANGFERQYDLTPSVDSAEIEFAKGGGVSLFKADFGGVDAFLKTIEVDVKPRIYALARVNREDQTLFGHSLGGLAVLDALFTEPTAFRTFIAASPSIWWDHKIILQKEGEFSHLIEVGTASPRILITVGGKEEDPIKLPLSLPEVRRMQIEKRNKDIRMIGDACSLAKRLKSLHGARGYQAGDCVVFPEQSHGISVWPSIGRAISFAF